MTTATRARRMTITGADLWARLAAHYAQVNAAPVAMSGGRAYDMTGATIEVWHHGRVVRIETAGRYGALLYYEGGEFVGARGDELVKVVGR